MVDVTQFTFFVSLKPLNTLPNLSHPTFLQSNRISYSQSLTKMPRKRLPVFQKVSNLLKIPAFIPKFRKPIIAKLLLVKKMSRKSRDLKLLRHYDYGFLGEYQFSPSSTPLIPHHPKRLKNRSFGDLCSLLFLCNCLGDLKGEGGGFVDALPLPAFEDGFADEFPERFDSGDEDESVDQRAERFIERFYQEMRMQRQESF